MTVPSWSSAIRCAEAMIRMERAARTHRMDHPNEQLAVGHARGVARAWGPQISGVELRHEARLVERQWDEVGPDNEAIRSFAVQLGGRFRAMYGADLMETLQLPEGVNEGVERCAHCGRPIYQWPDTDTWYHLLMGQIRCRETNAEQEATPEPPI